MQLKLNETQLPVILAIARELRDANKAAAAAKKSADDCKVNLRRFLKDEKSVELDVVKTGEMVSIGGLVTIQIGCQSRFDSTGFRIAQPELFREFTKDCRMEKFVVGCLD